MSLKVVIVTSAQPSANPRMLKSAITLSELGFEVTVIYAKIAQWASSFDLQIFENYKKIKWIGVGLSNQKSILSYYIRLRQKFWKIFNFFTLFQYVTTAKSFTLYSQELESETLKNKADLYIGHNPGALRAIVLASKKYHSKTVFDLEDYYSGEFRVDSIYYKLINKYESIYVPQLNFATVSSPLIADLYKIRFTDLYTHTLLNVFPIRYLNNAIVPYKNGPLKLVWFSQFVGLERGLQNVLKAISFFGDGEIEFTIIGNCNRDRRARLNALISELGISAFDIKIVDVLSEFELFATLHTQHIGIASELPSLLNKDLCMSNKMFSYMLAGLSLAVSNTKGQSFVMKSNPEIGFIFDHDDEIKLVQGLNSYIKNPDLLQMHRENALSLAKNKYNWETQSEYWVSLINDLVKA